MKDIRLLGVGNSIVDALFSISNEELDNLVKQFSLQPGGFKLSSDKEQAVLLEVLGDRARQLMSGGSVANSMILFAQLGGRAAFLSALGGDRLGEFFASEFSQIGIKLAADIVIEQPSGSCVILVTPDGQRTMSTCLAANLEFATTEKHRELVARSDWLFMEGYLVGSDRPAAQQALKNLVEFAKHSDCKIALTLSDPFIVDLIKKHWPLLLQQSQLIFCNLEEGRRLIGAATSATPDDIMAGVGKIIPNDFIMTASEQGAFARFGGKHYRALATTVNVVDTTGAGDAFAGAFMATFLDNTSNSNEVVFQKSLDTAAFYAGRIIEQVGARFIELPIEAA